MAESICPPVDLPEYTTLVDRKTVTRYVITGPHDKISDMFDWFDKSQYWCVVSANFQHTKPPSFKIIAEWRHPNA